MIRRGTRLAALLALAGIGLCVAPARGQGWVVDASAGGAAHDLVAASLSTRNAILGVRYEGPRWLYLSAGAPLDSASQPWAAGGLGGRLRVDRAGIGLGLDLGAHLFGYRDPSLDVSGGGAILEALPFVALSRGGARLELRSGVQHYGVSDGGGSLQRTAHDSGARLSFAPASRVTLNGELRYVRTTDGDFPYAGVGAEVSLGAGGVWGYAGRWSSAAVTSPLWGVGGSFPVGAGIRLYGSLSQESEDPLFWNLPRRSWSIGVSRSLGPRAAPSPLPLAPPVAGQVTIRLPLADAESAPLVAGDFNDWKPVAMQRAGDAWAVTFPLSPGIYRYAFQRADGSWFVPESVPNRVDDGFGGHSAVLVVAAPSED